jgi:hypothetical protein
MADDDSHPTEPDSAPGDDEPYECRGCISQATKSLVTHPKETLIEQFRKPPLQPCLSPL